MIDERHKDAAFQLYYWQYTSGLTNFHTKLYDLFCKADCMNYPKLKRGFPEEAKVYEEWKECSDPVKLFKKWGFIPSKEF